VSGEPQTPLATTRASAPPATLPTAITSATTSLSPPASAKPRRGYIDWLRGLAVVIMIEAHTFDSWTAASSREGLTYWYVQLIAGWGAPIFLFLAGVSVALASGSKARRGLDGFAASTSMQKRGLQIFGLALLFRVQAWLLSPGATLYGILKVDILNIMGPAIAASALVWGLVPSPADTSGSKGGATSSSATIGPLPSSSKRRETIWRIVALSAVASLLALLTPIVRHSEWLALLPDPIEWYLRPWPGRTTFTFFPWAGFVFAGAAVGVLLDRVREARGEGRLNLCLGIAGAAIALASFGASYLPSPYAQSSFWTSSPCFFFLRVGVLVLLLSLAYAWSIRPAFALTRGAQHYSPLIQFGQTSLFVYWIHVEMVYGILSYPLHRALTLPQALVAFLLFTGAMFWLSIWKTRIARRWQGGGNTQDGVGRGDAGGPSRDGQPREVQPRDDAVSAPPPVVPRYS
jgi:uncharacterized membrane protein